MYELWDLQATHTTQHNATQHRLFGKSLYSKRLQIHMTYSFREDVFLAEYFSNYFLFYKLLKAGEGPKSSLI